MATAEQLTTTAAAKLLGCNPSWVRALAQRGELGAERVAHPRGAYYLVDAAAVRAYRPSKRGRPRAGAPQGT